MTEFNKGDRIAHAEDHGTGDGSASDICAEPGCNCDLDRRFPAPLDPAKVKPETITDPYDVREGGARMSPEDADEPNPHREGSKS